MRYSASEKFEIIELVEQSADPSHTGADWDPKVDVLRLEQPLPSRLWRTASPDRDGSGTRSLTRSGRRSYLPGQLEHRIGEFVEHYNNVDTTRAWTT